MKSVKIKGREITWFYGEGKENEHVRIFDNRDFGYNRIMVERPWRLNFALAPERIESLE